jgi:hypothetical protein
MSASHGRSSSDSLPSRLALKCSCSWCPLSVARLQPARVGPVFAVCVRASGEIVLYLGIKLTAAIASRRPTGRFSLGWMPVQSERAFWSVGQGVFVS